MNENEKTGKKVRKYNEAALKSAIESVLDSRLSIYLASKEYNVPWTTLKTNVERVKKEREQGITNIKMLKMGRPFSLSVNLEQSLMSYIIKMQELGFGLSVNQIRQIAFSLAEAGGYNHKFNANKTCAGWNWWVGFKERYGLSLRTPENLSAGRAMCSNPVILADFFEKLEATLYDHNLMDSPDRMWNCDETGLMYVNKPTKIVTKVGKKYVYNRTYAEKGQTTTVLSCINAAGHFLPPLVIFKGVRHIPELSNGAMPNSLTRLSKKGWINADLFYEWLQFFNKNIAPARPVLLIMDSHASHITPQVLEYAKLHQIILFTMPAHTSHILQPLDVGVFRPLKAAWRAKLQDYKLKHPNSTPSRFDFHQFLTPVYERSFTPSNIRGGFRKAGIYPLNKNALCPEAVAPSTLSDQPVLTEQFSIEEIVVEEDHDVEMAHSEIDKTSIDPLCAGQTKETNTDELLDELAFEPSDTTKNLQPENKKIEIHDILVLPTWKPKSKPQHKRAVPKAQCLTPVVAIPSSSSFINTPSKVSLRHFRRPNKKEHKKQQVQPPPQQKHTTKSKTKEKKKEKADIKKTAAKKSSKSSISDDDWVCGACNGRYSQDVKLKNGADWITCSFCINPYHMHCQSQVVGDNQTVFMCDNCSIDDSSGEE